MRAQSDLSSWIRDLRAQSGLTQEQFAARLGVTCPTINRWENRRTSPSPLALQQLRTWARQLDGARPHAVSGHAVEEGGHP